MKFIIREKISDRYFAEPGAGLTSRDKAHVFDTDHITLCKHIYHTYISYKQDMPHPSYTDFDRKRYVIIPVGDL